DNIPSRRGAPASAYRAAPPAWDRRQPSGSRYGSHRRPRRAQGSSRAVGSGRHLRVQPALSNPLVTAPPISDETANVTANDGGCSAAAHAARAAAAPGVAHGGPACDWRLAAARSGAKPKWDWPPPAEAQVAGRYG